MPQTYEVGPGGSTDEEKIGAAEDGSLGIVPPGMVYAGAIAAADSQEAARFAIKIAQHIDIPDTPTKGKKKRPPVIDPLTGEAIAFRRARELYQLGTQLGPVLASRPLRPHGASPGRKPVDPKVVLQYVKAMEQSLPGEAPAELTIAYALDMDQKGVSPEGFALNLREVQKWDQDTGTVSEEEAITIARWWTEHKSNLISPRDIVSILDPEIQEEIAKRKDQAQSLRFAGVIHAGELDSLVAARIRAIENPEMLQEARVLMEEMVAPTWMDRALAGGMGLLDQLYKTGQHIAVDMATPAVFLLEEAQALVPGGATLGDALRTTQKDRSYLIQRINEGGSIGEVYAENGYFPRWVGVAFDFAIGWKLDPLILGGKLLTGIRQTRAAPALLEAQSTLGRGAVTGLVPGGRRFLQAYDARWGALQDANFQRSIRSFSKGGESRRLMNAAYKGDNALFRESDRLQFHFEATKGLDTEFLLSARRILLEKFPRASKDAADEWAQMLRAHFGIKPPVGSLAEQVVRVRQGLTQTAEAAVTAKPVYIFGKARPVEEIVDQVTPLTMRFEVPHRLLPIPGMGGIKLTRLKLGESLTGTALGRDVKAAFNINPGNVFKIGFRQQEQLFRRGTRWRVFPEDELRTFQTQATKIISSGTSVERRLISLLEKMDEQAIARIARKYGVADDAIPDLVSSVTFRTRQANKATLFGVTGETERGARVATRPLLETQLVDEYMTMDPILIRKLVKRYAGSVRNMLRVAPKNLGSESQVSTAFWKSSEMVSGFADDVRRGWKTLVVPRPAYIGRVILGDENARFLATTASLMERVVSQELKLGIGRAKLNVGATLDRAFTQQLKLGDEVIDLARPGAYAYEPLANTTFRTEELLDDLMRRAATTEKAMKNSGNWGIVTPEMREHLVLWGRALNYQLGGSDIGRVALESVASGDDIAATAAKLRKWALGPGRNTVRSRIAVDISDADDLAEWADDLARLSHSYTVADPDIARLAMSKGAEVDLLGRIPIENRPTVHGPLMSSMVEQEGQRLLHRLGNTAYKAFVTTPENILNRQPYYKMWKRRAERSYLTMLENRGLALTDEVRAGIDASSRQFALEQVRRIMFDFTENSRIGEMASAFVPFVQPWAEAYSVWGHILVHRNPAMVGYVAQLGKVGFESGFVRHDENGELVIPWGFWQRAMSWLPWVNELPDGMNLSAPLKSLNLFLSQNIELGGLPIPVPGLAPWAAYPLKKFFEGTENPHLTSYLFEYGPGTPFVSSWMERTARAIWPDAFNDERDDAGAMDFLKLYQYLGTDVDENGEPLPFGELKERALGDARRLNALLAMTGFVAPTAGRVSFPEGFEEKEAELDDLIDTLGYRGGVDTFLEKYPELTLMTIGKTTTAQSLAGLPAPRIPTSDFATATIAQPGFSDFAKRYPAWASMLILSRDEQWNDSTIQAFSQQLNDGLIEYKTLDRFLTEGQDVNFWKGVDAMYSWYTPRKEKLDGLGLGDDNEKVEELERARREALHMLYVQYPASSKKVGIREVAGADGEAVWEGSGATPPPELVLAQAREIAAMEGFDGFPAFDGLRAYLEMRDPIAKEMAKKGIGSITDTTAERLGARLVTRAIPSGTTTMEREPITVFSEHPEFPLQAAVTEWNRGVGADVFRIVSAPKQADYVVKFGGEVVHGVGEEEQTIKLAETRRKAGAILIPKFDAANTSLLTHELGHALGLGHVGSGVMNGGSEVPVDTELARVSEIFGVKPETETVTEWEGGLTDRYETGKAAVLEAFPEVEPFIASFFDNDLAEVQSKGERFLDRLETRDPEKYAKYARFDTRFEVLQDATSTANSTDERNAAFAATRDYVDNLYRTDRAWMLKTWFDSKSFSAREQHMEGLMVRPAAFYSRFDWELSGVKLTDRAATWLAEVADLRAEIPQVAEQALLENKEFGSGDAYEDVDKYVQQLMGRDKSFATAVNAINTWGYGLWQSDLVQQKGKAGHAWTALRDSIYALNQGVIKAELHGPDSFDSEDDRRDYVVARQAISDWVQELRAWSPVFDQQVSDVQSTLRGDPFIEWLIPDTYFALGAVGD